MVSEQVSSDGGVSGVSWSVARDCDNDDQCPPHTHSSGHSPHHHHHLLSTRRKQLLQQPFITTLLTWRLLQGMLRQSQDRKTFLKSSGGILLLGFSECMKHEILFWQLEIKRYCLIMKQRTVTMITSFDESDLCLRCIIVATRVNF